jgi:hypothetical protein
VRERAQLLEPLSPRAPPQLVDNQRPHAVPALALIDDERADLAHMRAERGEFCTSHDSTPASGDDEPGDVHGDLVKRSRQQVALLEVG